MPNTRNVKPGGERRDQQTAAMLTKRERETVESFAEHFGMSLSTATRHLILRGLAAEGHSFTPSEDTDS